MGEAVCFGERAKAVISAKVLGPLHVHRLNRHVDPDADLSLSHR